MLAILPAILLAVLPLQWLPRIVAPVLGRRVLVLIYCDAQLSGCIVQGVHHGFGAVTVWILHEHHHLSAISGGFDAVHDQVLQHFVVVVGQHVAEDVGDLGAQLQVLLLEPRIAAAG